MGAEGVPGPHPLANFTVVALEMWAYLPAKSSKLALLNGVISHELE